MRLGAGAGRHAHQRDDHAVALDHAALDARIVRAALDVIDPAEVEHVFAGPARLAPGVRAAAACADIALPP